MLIGLVSRWDAITPAQLAAAATSVCQDWDLPAVQKALALLASFHTTNHVLTLATGVVDTVNAFLQQHCAVGVP